MTAPIPGYQTDIPDELTLGYIAWYTITKPRVTHDELSDLATTLGLDSAVIPPEPRVADAFKRACRYSERKGLELPMSQNTGNILIRPVAQTSQEIERHMVLEVVDPDGRTLEYHTVVEFKFVRAKDVLQVSKLHLPEYDELVENHLALFMSNFHDATTYIDAQLIRRMIREQLDRMLALPVRRQGSVYFIPRSGKEKTQALEQLCQRLEGSSFHSLPLVDTSKQREMVHAAFEEELHEESAQLISDMNQVIGKELTPKAWANYLGKLKHLREKYSEYTSLIKTEISQASIELDMIEKQLGNLRVKAS